MGNVFYLVQNAQTGSRAHLDSYAMNAGALLRRQSGRGVNLTIYLNLLPRVRTSAATLPLAPHAFVTATGTT